MLNTLYRLVAPKRFEVAFEDQKIKSDTIIVRPTYLSICRADQRYYQGERPVQIMKRKLPMALIHEAIGKVVYSENKHISVGQRVVMIPNEPVQKDDVIAENYLRSSCFRSSGYDGFMQELVYTTEDRILPLPENLPNEIAAFTELVTVSFHALRRFLDFSHKRRRHIGVWGDGNLGYITALLIKNILPNSRVMVCGVNEEKLSNFTFADETFLVNSLPKDFEVDHAFECVGGIGAEMAINQMIDVICPEGTIALLGVSEMSPQISTRMILEKGLRIFGSSRSGRKDFAGLIDLYQKNEEIPEYLMSLVNEIYAVRSLEDMNKVFEMDKAKQMGKIVMKWEG